MALLDLLGRRWALRILWSLYDGAMTFRELQARCDGMSPSVLNQRLHELKEAEIVELCDEGYQLTIQGEELMDAFRPVNEWSKRWARRMRFRMERSDSLRRARR